MNATVQINPQAQRVPSLSSPKRRKVENTGKSTTNEIWQWTLTREAIAPCFIEDAFTMKENSTKGELLITDSIEANFYWLKRVPCRTVKIAGLCVGIQIYERRIRYTVDDGTGVIDCLYKAPLPPRSPTKSAQGKKTSTANAKSRVLAPEPIPVARVGNSVIIIGRVVQKYETREIIADNVEKCSSLNDELQHWSNVRRLHRDHYSLSTPFQIPRLASPVKSTVSTTLLAPSTPVKLSTPMRPKASTREEPTLIPSRVLNIGPSTAQSTPSIHHDMTPSSTQMSSPAMSIGEQSPQKLRHPSRLHSRDLNSNTFRIYVKHYMDLMCYAQSIVDSDDESDTSSITNGFPPSPTKPSSRLPLSDATPRPKSKPPISNNTPRPYIPPLSYDQQPQTRSSFIKNPPIMTGFTLSYLRRVPELADMAKRVVKAVAKRRLREERQKAKEASGSSTITQTKSSTRSRVTDSNIQTNINEKCGPRIKRLYQSTIIQLLKEGSIVLWDGPVQPCSTLDAPKADLSGLWKANVSSASADSTLFSATSSSIAVDEEEEIILSDPDTNEEAYVPLSPAFLADIVEKAIGKLTRIVGKGQAKRCAGVTKEVILGYLRKDDRWRYLSEWNIGEALQVLKNERRAWCIGRGMWELSLR